MDIPHIVWAKTDDETQAYLRNCEPMMPMVNLFMNHGGSGDPQKELDTAKNNAYAARDKMQEIEGLKILSAENVMNTGMITVSGPKEAVFQAISLEEVEAVVPHGPALGGASDKGFSR